MATSIDLQAYKTPITKFLKDSIARFAKDHVDIQVSAMGIYCTGFNPYVYLSFDTREHSDAHLQEFREFGLQDEHGRFCDNPPDFEFQFAEFDFIGYPDLHEIKSLLVITDLDGKTQLVDLDEDEERYHQIIFEFLVSIVRSVYEYEVLNREANFRIIIRMHGSGFEKLWIM